MGAEAKGSHQWLIEFERVPDDNGKFMKVLDTTLREVNSDYDAKRYKDITLEPPHLEVARPGLFFVWLKQKKKLGRSEEHTSELQSRPHLVCRLPLEKKK